MKKTAIAILMTSAIGLTACGQQDTDLLKVEEQKLETEAQQQAYAMGASVGQFIEQKMKEQEALDVNLDKGLVVKGFVAALQGQSQLDMKEIQTLTLAMEAASREKQKAISEAKAETNVAEGEKFLAENAEREGVTVTDSGLQYEVMSEGDGASPTAEDTVTVHYKGTLLDGTEFDSSYSRGEPATFPLSRVIPGWTEGVQLMKVGSKFKFFIPSELAYGERSTGKITPNSTLVFEVELLDVASAEGAAE
ncbi:FKBP-type peptidyl-prolyl cis-trans isomerase [Paraglaciecola agarilytica]|jgi:FKBP-type peptidyl-prolyl cis-trans isomerase FkpA|uniref:Peptidyl-prolyl cis-trans isomerase n=2 Tax=Paraglaciecola chathamensis TaxID=368405 RepID=A0ABS0WE21_9ALTE|nr:MULTISPECIES: FKBP-type peptidyl-prolyl cis-trans isomerase [Paraglaciecola]MBJ2136714.1 FKBP-type peptidyl-prolyl cis-trans isomerase [Paraglaciecola chathamensis]MBU3017760.1 FKBP-type peptidyl-prolyl cis-trans isomerase [Paraglaciecola agarilytica]MDO6560196.1 FKBP-type peptidyl-prolyl cis-trans isomerase [Paraglaciecola chathamensis]GAC05171.1 FKBP-type peptidyl-prolyl cis-trans isomerase FkpA [Paraglaciecola agarilytica NO2]|tara:strand:- start:298 stop:1047 length:750 start_codon:yes stop_codon:yes gene_type:complete